MYGIFTYTWEIFRAKVGKYSNTWSIRVYNVICYSFKMSVNIIHAYNSLLLCLLMREFHDGHEHSVNNKHDLYLNYYCSLLLISMIDNNSNIIMILVTMITIII